MEPLKFSLTFEPPQIGLLYKRHPNDKKKQLFVIQQNGLIFQGDPDKITAILFQKHSDYLSPHIVSFEQVLPIFINNKTIQVKRLVCKLLEYLQEQQAIYEEEEQEQMRYNEGGVYEDGEYDGQDMENDGQSNSQFEEIEGYDEDQDYQ